MDRTNQRGAGIMLKKDQDLSNIIKQTMKKLLSISQYQNITQRAPLGLEKRFVFAENIKKSKFVGKSFKNGTGSKKPERSLLSRSLLQTLKKERKELCSRRHTV